MSFESAKTQAQDCRKFTITVPALDFRPGREVPFVIGVLGEFPDLGSAGPLSARSFAKIAPLESPHQSRGNSPARGCSAGLEHLIRSCARLSSVQIKVLHATKEEVLRDVSGADTLEQTYLLKHLEDQELGTFGGDPLSIIVADYEFSPNSRQDVLALSALAQIGRQSYAPVVTSVPLSDLPVTVPGRRDPEEACALYHEPFWKAFRASPEAKSLYLAVPRLSLVSTRGDAAEDADAAAASTAIDDVNPAYFVASRLALAHETHGWPATISAEVDVRMLLRAQIYPVRDLYFGPLRLPPLRWAEALSRAGFVPITGRHGSDSAVIFNCRSASSGEQPEDRLLHELLACRLAQHIVLMCRESATHDGLDGDELTKRLERWLEKMFPESAPATAADGTWIPFRKAPVLKALRTNNEVVFRLRIVANPLRNPHAPETASAETMKDIALAKGQSLRQRAARAGREGAAGFNV